MRRKPMILPSLFLSHGAPDLLLSDHPAKHFLCGLSRGLPRPKAIIIQSPHWMTSRQLHTGAPLLETLHDFGGFDAELYELAYPARSEAWLTEAVRRCLAEAGFASSEHPVRGLDHGAWAPLLMAFPDAAIPVLQLSLHVDPLTTGQTDADQAAARQVAIGRALAPLRRQGVLIIGSGGSVHNLRTMKPEGTAAPDWARAFEAWIDERVLAGDLEVLAAYETKAPYGLKAHPTPEHLLPLFFAAGAGGRQARAQTLHRSFSYGSLGMAAWAFA